MKKDNFGICINFYAVLGFVLALLGHTTLALLLLGFVIVVHKDQWLITQVMQAFFLSIISGVISTFLDILTPLYKIPILGLVISGTIGVITSIISLIVLVMAIIGIIKVAKGADANLPLVKGFANKAFGIVKNVTYTQSAPQDSNNSNNTQN
ncbi:MAG: hypothetical protein K2N85_06475 [Lachnospiraceae bacterium]|nr:hypothetical protein [Lachnospiraceae bacterium]